MATTTDLPAADLFLSPAVMRRIHGSAKRLCRKFALCQADRDDLRQDFHLTVLQARQNYDAEKCPIDRFVLMVINRRYKHHVRRLMQLREGRGSTLDTIGFDDMESGIELHVVDPLGESSLKQVELRHDLAIAFDDMSIIEVRICELLIAGHSPYSASKELGVAASTVTRAMERIAQHLEARGLSPNS